MGQLTNTFATTPENENDATKVATLVAMAQILDSAIAGKKDISTTGGTTTLQGTANAPEAQNMLLNVSGTLVSNATIEIPVSVTTGRNRIYVVKNGTSGAFTLTVKAVGGTGVTVTQGTKALLLYDGSDITHAISDVLPLGGAWAAWTPTWVNLTVGSGAVSAKYLQVGKLIICRLNFTLGSGSSVDGDLSFTLPVNRVAFGGEDGLNPLGPVRFYDVSAGFVYEGVVVSPTVSTAILRAFDASGTYLRGVLMSGTVPFTWASPDEFSAQFSYEAA